MAFLTEEPIALDALVSEVTAPNHGAIATFSGAVRDEHQGRAVVRLEYSGYAEMAEREIDSILREAEARWACKVAVRHRMGVLEIGEVAVVVAVGAAHREAAFTACRFVIDELKRRVPIWKKETYGDGSVAWVDPTATRAAVGGEP